MSHRLQAPWLTVLGAAALSLGCSSGASSGGAATPPGALDTSASVLTRNKHETRDGFFIQPSLTKLMAAKMMPDAGFKATFTGAMFGSPLYLENGPGGHGVFFAVATNNNVYALDETTGAIVWMHNIGAAPPVPGVNCGGIHPIGVISTPVIDAATKTIYVAGGVGVTKIDRHEVHALDTDTGDERDGWPVIASAVKGNGTIAMNTPAQNQRSALSLVNGVLYVAYGGHGGDCDSYRGWVVAIDTRHPTTTGAWTTGGSGEAIWAAGGMASDGNGVFAVTGNRTGGGAGHQDSEEVVRVTGMGAVNRATGIYYPASWLDMDNKDADFGSSSPVVIEVPGGQPSTLVAAAAKDGHLYLLDAANLGGMAGHLQDIDVAEGAPMTIHAALAAYPSAAGPRVTLNSNGGNCKGIASVLVAAGSPPTGKLTWCAPGGNASPIATSIDGKNELIVWYMNGGKLNGVDGESGMPLVSVGACDGVEGFTSPIAVKGRLIAGGDGHLCSWSPQ